MFASFWELLSSGLSAIIDVVTVATTYITAIPRGIATLTYYINNMPAFVAPFLITIISVCAIKTVFSLV